MTYTATPTFWIAPTDEVAVGLRRYSSGRGGFTCADGYHSALAYTGREHAEYDGTGGRRFLAARSEVSHADPQWPTTCERCDYRFTDGDHWQTWQELIYCRPDTGAEYVLHSHAPPFAPSAPPGATWNAWWMPKAATDGISLMVRLPNGHDWSVDSQASNCTRPGEPHQCWVRHGDPREAQVTVDKIGDTCAAGAGSIAAGDYHGFLQSGVLTAG